MTKEELTKIREEKNQSKKDFAAFLGITPMLLGRYEKGTCAIPDSVAEKLKGLSDQAVATEIEVKKTVRKTARDTKEVAENVAAVAGEVVAEQAVASEIEAKKTVRKAGRKAKKKAEEVIAEVKEAVKTAVGVPNIIIQSPMGGYISTEDIAKKVPKGAEDIYVRVDENKLYYVLANGKTGDVDIWD